MLKNSYKLLFTFSLIMGTFISINSSSWLSIWMGLEINLLSFIPLMMNSNNLLSSEAAIKYFLTQTLASSVLLFSIILFSILEKWNSKINIMNFINLLFISSLMMKMGMAPFHFWFPNVMEGLNWINNFILMTWQKIAPMIILSFCLNLNIFLFSIILSAMIGAIGGLNQTSLRKLMAFSSISHLGWMVSNMMNNENLWKIYFLLYSFLSLTIIMLFNNLKTMNLNQMYSMITKFKTKKILFFIPLLSLGGLPPFLGFFPKWMTIELMIFNDFYLIIFILINFSLITLYFYTRICYSAFLLNQNSLNWNFSWIILFNKNFTIFNLLIFFSTFGLIFINTNFLLT